MSPLSPKTLTRIDPAVPPLWRDERTVQLGGADGPRLEAAEPWVAPLLGRMSAGFERRAFDVIAHAAGAPREEARALLRRLQPLLVDDPPPLPAAWVENVDITDARCEFRMREALADEGVPAGSRGSAGHVAVVLVAGAAAALRLAGHLRGDLNHLPVAFAPGAVTVGPLVIPGETPCLSCRDGHERDRDPAWPRLHAQLIGREPGPISAVRIAEAAALVARVLSTPPDDEMLEARLTAGGAPAWRSVRFHAECRCREPSSRSLPGTATAPARPDPPNATRTATGFARPA